MNNCDDTALHTCRLSLRHSALRLDKLTLRHLLTVAQGLVPAARHTRQSLPSVTIPRSETFICHFVTALLLPSLPFSLSPEEHEADHGTCKDVEDAVSCDLFFCGCDFVTKTHGYIFQNYTRMSRMQKTVTCRESALFIGTSRTFTYISSVWFVYLNPRHTNYDVHDILQINYVEGLEGLGTNIRIY